MVPSAGHTDLELRAPGSAIQADILAMPTVEPGYEPIREPEMHAVLREVLWSEQRNRWGASLKKAA